MKQTINIIEIDSRDDNYQSGISRYFDVLAAGMPPRVKTFRIIFCHTNNNGEARILLNDDELKVFHPHAFPAACLYEAVLTFIGKRLAEMDNLIVKSNCLGFESLAYLIKSRFYCKTMGVLHCLPQHSLKFGGFPPANPFRNMDHIILVCDRGREYLGGVKNKRPFSIIRNGIPKPETKAKESGGDDVFRFIFANGWARHKGFLKILPAIRKVAEKHKIEVMVLGGENKGDEIPGEISELPIIKTGLIDDIRKIEHYYKTADCALFASESEACSFAGIEAMAHNLPIVSTDAAGLVEMFGKAALFVKMNERKEINTTDYAAQMIKIIENKRLRIKLGIFGYARYFGGYTAGKMIKDTVALYEKLLK
ncbi:MAG: glycosyltransferase family 4 protein [Rickettsiales bacterium]|jgi:glycosyltransferase involved in cell wall biosynthesis|nr:glycosyltransferase family 4 protein [Rickettsiales bacterium]